MQSFGVPCLHYSSVWVAWKSNCVAFSEKKQTELSFSQQFHITFGTFFFQSVNYIYVKGMMLWNTVGITKKPCSDPWNGKIDWWLVRVTLVVDWLFLSWNFGMVVGTFSCSVNVHRVVVLCWGGGDTSTVFVWGKLFVPTGGGDPKT